MAALTIPTAQAVALNEDLQCVPYARQLSGVQIFGDAHTWWGQAEGSYAKGRVPKFGAVLAFKPFGKMQLGHVAAVSKVIDNRTILISHANWSTINGKRGHIENNVQVVDVSDRNDWSRVRVWYTPIGALGGTEWPTHGFIYPDKAPKSMPSAGAPVQYAAAKTVKPVAKIAPPAATKPAAAPRPDRLAQRVAPAYAQPAQPARVQYTASVAPPKPSTALQNQRPLRDYNAQPARIQSPAPHRAAPAPYQSAAVQSLPRGYTPSTSVGASPAANGQPRNLDDLLASVK